MPYFLVSRTDHVGYDDYDAFVVKAKNKGEVLKHCFDPFLQDEQWSRFTPENTVVEKLDASRPDGFVLGSFNAG